MEFSHAIKASVKLKEQQQHALESSMIIIFETTGNDNN
jgi:hypothetical protein